MILPVDMPGLAPKRALLLFVGQEFDGAIDNVVPVGFQPFRRENGVRKRNGPRDPRKRSGTDRSVLWILQGTPTANDLGRIGQVDLAFVCRQVGLQGCVDMLLGHREHDHLVVGQQIVFDGVRERQPVELRTVRIWVIHRKDFDIVARRLRLRAGGVKARRRSHEQPLPSEDSIRIVDQHERRGLVAGTIHSSRPMRLVAKNEVEGRRVFSLRPFDQAERMVRAEDHGQGVAMPLPERRRNCRRVGRNRQFQFLERSVFVVPSSACIGTNSDIAVRYRPVSRPFPHGLDEERDRRHQVEDPAPASGSLLGDAQGSVRLACSTRHDQLAAVMVLEALDDLLKRFLLVRPERVGLGPQRQIFRFRTGQIGPVEGPLSQVAETQNRAGGLQSINCPDGIRPPLVTGVDDNARGERIPG